MSVEPVRPEATPELVADLGRSAGVPLSRERCEALTALLAGLLEGCARLARAELEGYEPFVSSPG